MKLQGKLVLNAMISLIACLALVAYIIFELIRINSQSSNLVPAMLNVQLTQCLFDSVRAGTAKLFSFHDGEQQSRCAKSTDSV